MDRGLVASSGQLHDFRILPDLIMSSL